MDYGLIGEHLGHSYSKEIHESIGRYGYELKEIEPDKLDAFMRAHDFKAINVTIPYKEQVIPYLDEIDQGAAAIGAVNCIVNRDGRLYGYNTDFYGMKALIERMGVEVKGAKVLVLGTGGTSKTGRAVMTSLGAREIYTVSRKPGDGVITYEEAYAKHADAEVILNTTPVGMYPKTEGMPIRPDAFPRLRGVVDAVFNPTRTDLVIAASKLGIPAEGGLYMLVMQAVRAAELFTDQPVEDEVGDRIYKKLLLDKTNLVFIGMPGSGKSSIGRRLAQELDMPLFDSDAELEAGAGRTIKEIFAAEGEQYFRDLETRTIEELSRKWSCIISTGGGAVLRGHNVDCLKRNGIMIFLDRKPDDIKPTDDRPLGDSMDKINALYTERLPIYKAAADYTVKVSGTVQDMADKISRLIYGKAGRKTNED